MSDYQEAFSHFPTSIEIAGIAAALLPFVCPFRSTNYIAIAAGATAIAIALFIATALLPHTPAPEHTKRAALVIAILAVGIFQVGAGIF